MDPENNGSERRRKRTAETIDLTGSDNEGSTSARRGPVVVDLTSGTTASTSTQSSILNGRRRRRRRLGREQKDSDEVVEVVNETTSAFASPRFKNQNAANKKKPAAACFDCSVCLETNLERFRGYQLGTCGHLFCRECLYEYIQNKLKEKAVGRALVCPGEKCQMLIHPVDVRACTLEVGDSASWQTYQELSTEAYLDSAVAAGEQQQKHASVASAPRLRRCPTNNCNFTFEYDCPTTQQHNQYAFQQGQLFCGRQT